MEEKRMRSKLFTIVSLIILASMALAACQPQTIIQTVEVEKKVVETQVVEKTVVVEKEGQKVIVTATPVPAAPAKEFNSKDPKTYIAATFGDPETFDPALDYESAGLGVILNVYDTLIFYNYDDPNSFVPNIATEVPSLENGGISADGKTYTWKIRQGVKFHDGSMMTVEDVAYSFQRGILQGGSASPQCCSPKPSSALASTISLI
jgi:peptide/nickel transport system substrate-binding protein